VNAIVALLAEQCPDLNLADTEAAQVSVKTDATIAYRLNRGEHQRRQAVGLTAVTRLDQLDLMMELPAGLPVLPRDTDWRMVKKLPHGCVDITLGGVVRQILKPLDVRLALVTGQQWKPGMIRAGRFGAYCNRVLALTGKPRSLAEKAIEADFWGIGLIVNATAKPELVVAPTPFEQYRHTPAGWAFAEEIYRQVVAQKVRR
jgi:hypothetical protein